MRKIALAAAALLVLSVSQASADPAAGESLFNGGGKCKNCHKTTEKKKVGPGLAGITKRASEDWIKAWLKDPQGVWEANEGYTKTLKAAMKKESKPKTSHKTKKLSDQEIADLMDYMKGM